MQFNSAKEPNCHLNEIVIYMFICGKTETEHFPVHVTFYFHVKIHMSGGKSDLMCHVFLHVQIQSKKFTFHMWELSFIFEHVCQGKHFSTISESASVAITLETYVCMFIHTYLQRVKLQLTCDRTPSVTIQEVHTACMLSDCISSSSILVYLPEPTRLFDSDLHFWYLQHLDIASATIWPK